MRTKKILSLIIENFIGKEKQIFMKNIDRIENKVKDVREILIEKMNVKIGRLEVKLNNLERKLFLKGL